MSILFLWNKKKHKVFPLAEYTPLFFNHHLNGEVFTIFQTIKLIDFKCGLHPENIDLLVKESGVFIGYTYFPRH